VTLNQDQFGHIINSPMNLAWDSDVWRHPETNEQDVVDFGDIKVPRHNHYFQNGTQYLSGSDGRKHCRGGGNCPPKTLEVRLAKATHVFNMAYDPEYYANEGGWEGPVPEATRNRILGIED